MTGQNPYEPPFPGGQCEGVKYLVTTQLTDQLGYDRGPRLVFGPIYGIEVIIDP
jgi:hypothetical protein